MTRSLLAAAWAGTVLGATLCARHTARRELDVETLRMLTAFFEAENVRPVSPRH